MATKDSTGPWMEAGREAGLVLSAQQGDRASYLELVEHYAPAIYRLAHSLTPHPEDTLDLARETFIHGWKNIKHLPVGKPLYPWLMRAARKPAPDQQPDQSNPKRHEAAVWRPPRSNQNFPGRGRIRRWPDHIHNHPPRARPPSPRRPRRAPSSNAPVRRPCRHERQAVLSG